MNLSSFDLTQEASNVPILAPGFGHQGALLSEARSIFGAKADQVIFSVSRSVLTLGKAGLQKGVIVANDELNRALG
jgi:orotidine-5'-phosphate decarboxylase